MKIYLKIFRPQWIFVKSAPSCFVTYVQTQVFLKIGLLGFQPVKFAQDEVDFEISR
jgi:cytochrome c oxidase subunit IV